MNPELPVHFDGEARTLAPLAMNPALATLPGRCLLCGASDTDIPDHAYVVQTLDRNVCNKGRRCDRWLPLIAGYDDAGRLPQGKGNGPLPALGKRILGPAYLGPGPVQAAIDAVNARLPEQWRHRYLSSLVALRTLTTYAAALDHVIEHGVTPGYDEGMAYRGAISCRERLRGLVPELLNFLSAATMSWRRRLGASKLRGVAHQGWDLRWADCHVIRVHAPSQPQHGTGGRIRLDAPAGWLAYPPQVAEGRPLSDFIGTSNTQPHAQPARLLLALFRQDADRWADGVIERAPRMPYDARWGTACWYSTLLGLHIPPLWHYTEDGYSWGAIP